MSQKRDKAQNRAFLSFFCAQRGVMNIFP